MSTHRFYITEEAFKAIDVFLSKRKLAKILRVGIKGGRGCAGFKYNIECTDYVSETGDVHFKCDNDVLIVIDKKSIRHLNGATLRWVQNQKEQGLKILNPNQKTTCRCGESFSV